MSRFLNFVVFVNIFCGLPYSSIGKSFYSVSFNNKLEIEIYDTNKVNRILILSTQLLNDDYGLFGVPRSKKSQVDSLSTQLAKIKRELEASIIKGGSSELVRTLNLKLGYVAIEYGKTFSYKGIEGAVLNFNIANEIGEKFQDYKLIAKANYCLGLWQMPDRDDRDYHKRSFKYFKRALYFYSILNDSINESKCQIQINQLGIPVSENLIGYGMRFSGEATGEEQLLKELYYNLVNEDSSNYPLKRHNEKLELIKAIAEDDSNEKSRVAKELELQKKVIANEAKIKKYLIVGTIVFSILTLALSISLYRGYKTNRKLNQAITTIQETQEKLIRQEQLSYEEKLATQRAEQEMKLLRAQMNPHFIFNALNSIHNCILQKDTMTASSSLTKFSRLVRRILESSRQAIVSLESELSTLELYIQLEQMRFNTKFDYKISIEPGIDMNEFSVPPLILQPFVENSIWHGLMPSSKKGIIEIEVKKRGDLLHFSIIDNGIGRQKSADLKAKSEHQHTSHGLAITKERLSMYNKVSNTDTFTIIDLYDTTGLPAGTKVEFDLTIQNYAA
ncbi:MAG: histidine kinase [Bacteroidetes bacterium]|nr:histidine kinase [Bacteroidota bacterium]